MIVLGRRWRAHAMMVTDMAAPKLVHDREWCEQRLAEGDTVSTIAEKSDVSRQTASAWLKRHGLAALKQPKPRPSAEQMTVDYERCGSIHPMADEYGISYATMRTWLFEAGVKMNEPATSGGQPRVEVDVSEVRRLRSEGATLQQIADEIGVAYETVRRRLNE